MFIFLLHRNKEQIDEMKQTNEAKLTDLNKKQEEFESLLKSHRRELDVSSHHMKSINTQSFTYQYHLFISDIHKHSFKVSRPTRDGKEKSNQTV